MLKEIRKDRGLTQKACAAALGIDLRRYRRIENGEMNLKIGQLTPLARVLGISISELLEAYAELEAIDASERKAT